MLEKEELLNILEVEQRLRQLENNYSLIRHLLNTTDRLEKKIKILEGRIIDLDPEVSDKL